MKSIANAILKTNTIPRVGNINILLKSSTLDEEQTKLILNCISELEYDLKNREVILFILEPENNLFFKILKNFILDKDIKFLIKNQSQILDGDTKRFQAKYPHFLFEMGQILNHSCPVKVREDDQFFFHKIRIKFNKLDDRYDEVRF